jgi:hypothetical protein
MAKHLTRKNKRTRRKYNYRKRNYKGGFWKTFKRMFGRNVPQKLCPSNYVYTKEYGCTRKHKYEEKMRNVIPVVGVGLSVAYPESYPENSNNDSDYE